MAYRGVARPESGRGKRLLLADPRALRDRRGVKTGTLNGEPLPDSLIPADRLEQDEPVGIVPGSAHD
jgi:hypothetical protein